MAGKPGTEAEQFKGWLYKWTNYIKGYQKRWFVIQSGYMSYYRSQADMLSACRGSVNLANAFIHTQEGTSFMVSNSGTMTFHLKAGSEVEKHRWVTALELAKSKAINYIEAEEDEQFAEPGKFDIECTARGLGVKLDELRTCCEVINKNCSALVRTLSELEQIDNVTDAIVKIKSVNERAVVFKTASNAMVMAGNDYLTLSTAQCARWQKLLQCEHERRVYLEDMVEQLGKQHIHLEKQIRKSLHSTSAVGGGVDEEGDDDDEDYYDAVEPDFTPKALAVAQSHRRTDSGMSVEMIPSYLLQHGDLNINSSDTDTEKMDQNDVKAQKKKSQKAIAGSPQSNNVPFQSLSSTNLQRAGDGGTVAFNINKATARTTPRRKTIPEKPNCSINMWSIVKNCIGKELSKIPMPVNFSEPLSFLQRLTEDFEYSDCLDRAAACTDSCLQMAYVAAFTVSSYANTTLRTGKPFNPLLGETYECDRLDDLGWRSFAEQVSHHPPTVAMYTEGRDWRSWQEFTMSSKFRGKYLQIIPLGISHLVFPKSGNHYTWRKVTTTVNNIIVGKLWVDNHGDMEIVNHSTHDICQLKYYGYSYFSNQTARRVAGVIRMSAGVIRYSLDGSWDDKMEGAVVLSGTVPAFSSKDKITGECKLGNTVSLWQRRMPPPELAHCYNFTQLAVELNEPEPGVAPTDSRNRPDQRLMEQGRWDEANDVKVILEEKQRTARKMRDNIMEEAASEGREYQRYEPKWFKKTNDPQTENLIHEFTHEYWLCKEKQDWSRCPDIYL